MGAGGLCKPAPLLRDTMHNASTTKILAAAILRIVTRQSLEPHAQMAIRPFASMLALSLVCTGCSPTPAAVDPATLVKDGCDQDPDLTFRNRIASAPPFKSAIELEHDELLLTVDPVQWQNLGYGMRQQIIAIFDCGDAGPGKYHTNVIVRSTDGTDLMKVPTTELMQWRAAGLAILKQDGIRADAIATDALVHSKSPG